MSTLGDLLRERRQEHQWSLEEASKRSRVQKRWLEALEKGDYEQLPADVYTRGFLRSYASLLGLPLDEVMSLYEQERGRPELVSIAPLSTPPRARSCILPGLGFALLVLVILGSVAVWIYFGKINPMTMPPTATAPIPTPTNILPTATPTVQVLLETPTPAPTVTPAETRTYEGLEAVLEFSADCWIRVIADGVETFQGTLRAGSTRTFTAQRELSIRFGNAGGVRVTLNGEDLGVQGESGQVVERTWTVEE